MRFWFALLLPLCALAQVRSVAITFDDLPYAGVVTGAQASEADAANRKLLAALKAHPVPVTGFVIQSNVESLGPAGLAILRAWMEAGFDLPANVFVDIIGAAADRTIVD